MYVSGLVQSYRVITKLVMKVTMFKCANYVLVLH